MNQIHFISIPFIRTFLWSLPCTVSLPHGVGSSSCLSEYPSPRKDEVTGKYCLPARILSVRSPCQCSSNASEFPVLLLCSGKDARIHPRSSFRLRFPSLSSCLERQWQCRKLRWTLHGGKLHQYARICGKSAQLFLRQRTIPAAAWKCSSFCQWSWAP